MDDFRAIPQMAEALQEMVAKGQARLATVVAVYPNEVDASLSDGSVARFATTHNGLAVGQKGVLINAMGGAKIFTPLGLNILPQYKLVEASFTFSTVGVYRIGNLGDGGDPTDKLGGLTFRGLDPSRPYTVDGTVSIRTSGTTARQFHLLFVATGAIEVASSFGIYQWEDANSAMSTFSALSLPVHPTPEGIIYVNPGVQTNTGVVTGTRSTIKASVF